MKKCDDIKRLQALTRTVLGHFERAVKLNAEGMLEEISLPAKVYEKMFGSKESYVGVLVDLSALLMKLNAADNERSAHAEAMPKRAGDLDEKDIKLIEEYLRKRKELSGD